MTELKLRAEKDGDIAALMAAEVAAGERAVSAAMRAAGEGLKTAWRGQITGAGLGTRLANTIRAAHYPKGRPSLNAAALVWSKAPVIVGAHDTGPLIRSRNGFWLAIPLPAAGKSTRGGRITPGEWERRTGLRLRFVYRRTGPSLLVAEGRISSAGRAVASRSKTGRGLTSVPVFLLVPQVKLPKRLDLARDAERVAGGLPGAIVAGWSRMQTRSPRKPGVATVPDVQFGRSTGTAGSMVKCMKRSKSGVFWNRRSWTDHEVDCGAVVLISPSHVSGNR